MGTHRRVRAKRADLLFPALVGLLVWSAVPAFALPQTSNPELELARTIRTTPFAGSSVSMKDHEGSTYVPSDNSLWLVDDNANAVYEVNATTGALKRTINRSAFNNAPKFGGGPVAGTNRTDDFESFAYDKDNDRLYLFSGPCCTSSILPTAFRLTRQSGNLQVESHQPLAAGSNYTASAWNFAEKKIYVGVGTRLRTYNYETNTAGPTFQVPNLAGILGMGFSSDGADLFVVTNAEALKRVAWATKTLVPGWTFDLLPFDVRDSRGVELINDQLYVSDGADSRPAGPLKYAVFVFNVLGSDQPPTASFTANPATGAAPLSVTFNNTTTGSTPMTWAWDFDEDNVTDSTEQNPTHVFSVADTYTVELTATNSFGPPSTTTRDVVVTAPPQPPVASFNANPTSGDAPLQVTFTDTSSGPPSSWDWNFGDGTPNSSAQNPIHTYSSPSPPGGYTVTLTVDNSAGDPSTAQTAITVTSPPPPQDLVGNPGFETDTTGWGITGSGTGVALTRVTSPTHTGGGAALLRNNSTGTRRCVLNDVPNWVGTTQAGVYTGSIWVRADSAGAKIKITFRELNGGTLVGSRIVPYTLSTTWQKLTLTYTPLQAGTSTLDLQVFVPLDYAPPGVCFYADDASITVS